MTSHHFEPATYTQLRHGDRVKIAQTYHGHLVGWWWPILTVDRVDWIRDDHAALMLRLTEPLPCGDKFVLITGHAMVDAGVRRITDPAAPTTLKQEIPMPTTVNTLNSLAHYPTPAGATVTVADLGTNTPWRYTSHCTGTDCPHKDAYRTADTAHRHAQAHAKKCYEQESTTTAA